MPPGRHVACNVSANRLPPVSFSKPSRIMLSDLRYAFRQILKFPGYTAVVVLTLGFGIAVNTQIFSMVANIFLRPMPVRDADQLVVVVERSAMLNFPHQLSFLDFRDIRADSKALTDHVAFFSTPAHVSAPGQTPERIWVDAVTPDAFEKLGITSALGRTLQKTDGELPPVTPVAVLSYRYWQNHFGGDPSIVGRTIIIDARQFTIVGVAKQGFDSFSAGLSISLFIPSGALPLLRTDADATFKYRSAVMWRILAYLRPGATIADANNELAVFAQRFAKDFPEEHRNTRFQAVLEQRARPDPAMTDIAPVFSALFIGLVTLVLFIACANVANLMGARALSRENELVVRTALGASRYRLIRQLLVESLLLAAIAGCVGWLLAVWGSNIITDALPISGNGVPIRREDSMGGSVLVFTIAISLIAGVAAGLFPALRASRIDLNEGLKRGGRQAIGGGRHMLRNMLVVGQIALSCVVLVASAQFLRGLRSAHDIKLGFNPDRLLTMSFDLGLQGYDQERGLRFERQLLERIRALPGVASASLTQHIPFSYNIIIRQHWPDNPTVAIPDGHVAIALSAVEPGFLKTFGVALLRGRDLAPTDDEKSPHVAVINEAMANALWPGKNPIGQHFHRDWNGATPIEVVGVVPTGRYTMLLEDPKPYYYTPLAQAYDSPVTLVIRTLGDPHAVTHDAREVIRAMDHDLPVYSVQSFEEHMLGSAFALMPLVGGASLAAIQGAIGLLLAIMGLYAVVSYGVTSRTREIGVRVALGATHSDVMRFVSREGLRLTAIGLGAGLVMALGLSFVLARLLPGVHALDPVAFPAVIVLLCATSALACYWPARRATRVDPMIALRAE